MPSPRSLRDALPTAVGVWTMTFLRALRWLCRCLSLCLAVGAGASSAEQAPMRVVSIPHRVAPDVSIVLKVAMPDGSGPFPVMVFNHGLTSASGPPDYVDLVETLRAHGIASVFPMRRGIAGSTGRANQPQVCDAAANESGVRDALDDIGSALDHVRGDPAFDPARVMLGGNSRGGMLSLLYPVRHPNEPKPAGIVSFVGIWMGSPHCPTLGIDDLYFREVATNRTVPSAWFHASRDSLYSRPTIASALAQAVAGGGRARLHFYDVDFWNGHKLLEKGSHLWKADLERFLVETGMISKGGFARP